jgi:hypothetical protein
MSTDVSEVRAASIIRAIVLMMKAARTSETSVKIQLRTRQYIPEDSELHRHAPAAFLPPGKGPPVLIGQEAGWAPEPVWTQRLEEKFFDPAGDRTTIARSSSP